MGKLTLDESFPHAWTAEILPARPVILPARHFVYPRQAEEVERGALEVLVRPLVQEVESSGAKAPGSFCDVYGPAKAVPLLQSPLRSSFSAACKVVPFQSPENSPGTTEAEPIQNCENDDRALAPAGSAQPFLATCALGFRDPAVPTGIWSAPNPHEICAVSGGYAYMIDTTAPERFTMIPYRPVLEVRAAVEAGLLLFVGHHSILAWGRDSQAWESEKLSDEGVTISAIEGLILRGKGWQLMTDKETPFAIDMRTGARSETDL